MERLLTVNNPVLAYMAASRPGSVHQLLEQRSLATESPLLECTEGLLEDTPACSCLHIQYYVQKEGPSV